MRSFILALSLLSFAHIAAMGQENLHLFDDQTNLETSLYGFFFPNPYSNGQGDFFEQSNDSFFACFPDQSNDSACMDVESPCHELPSLPLPPAVHLIESNEKLACDSCNNETGNAVTVAQSTEHNTPAIEAIRRKKVRGTIPLLLKSLGQGTLPKDLFEQVAFDYKLPSLKLLGNTLISRISNGTISEDQFNAFATYHSQCNWDGVPDQAIKYIKRLYVMQYTTISKKTRNRAPQKLPYQVLVHPVKKQGVRNTRNDLNSFEKANVRVCKALIKEGNYCDDIFNILAEKRSLRGKELLTLDTMLDFAVLTYRHLNKQALESIIDHLKKNPLRDNIHEFIIPILQGPPARQERVETVDSESNEEYDSAD